MKLLITVLFLSGALYAQSSQGYTPHDCAYNASGQPTVSIPCSAIWTDNTLPIPTLYYGYAGAAMDFFRSGVPNGLVHVKLVFIEPNKTGQGQRIFTVRVNNGLPLRLDVFREAGGAKKLLEVMVPLEVTDGTVVVQLRSQIGNVIISTIDVIPVATWPLIASHKVCSGATSPISDCTGLQYVELKDAAGNVTKMVAISAPDMLVPNPPLWTDVQ